MDQKRKPFNRRLRKRWKRARKQARLLSQVVRRYLVYLLTIAFWRCMVLLPLGAARRLGGALGLLAFHLVPPLRSGVLANLELAYGDTLPRADRLAICRRMFHHIGCSVAEGCFMSTGRAGQVLGAVEVQGAEHLQEALDTGQGILFLTGHYGNWELMGLLMARLVPRRVGAVARDLSNPWINKRVVAMREAHGVQIFPRGASGREYVRFLRQGGALAVLGDMDTSKGGGMFVPFFGRPAWTQTGIARLAWMGNARVLPAFIQRDPADPSRHRVRVEPMLDIPSAGDEAAFTAALTQAFTRAIEEAVRDRPDQWMWFHRRWRHQPPPLGAESASPGAEREGLSA